MHRLIQPTFVVRYFPLKEFKNHFYCSWTKSADHFTTADERKHMSLNSENILAASIAQSHVSPAVSATMMSSGAMPLLETVNPEVITQNLEDSASKILPHADGDKTPLPFEEIPGPAVLKIWEKYWKYVPLLGQLSWNRNVTPIKYLFNEYGCVVRINGPLVNDIVMIHRPEHIAEIFKQEGDTPIRSSIDILQHYRLNHRKYRSAGAFSIQSSEWLEVKRKVDQPLNQTVSDYFGELNSVSDELITRIRNIRNRQDEVPGNFHQEISAWGLECFYTVVFNRHLGFLDAVSKSASEPTKIIDALITAHTYMSRCETGFQVWRFFQTVFSKKLFTACDVLDDIIAKYIRQMQNKLQSLSMLEKGKVASEKNSPLLEKMMILRIHPEDISTLLMDMLILGVQAIVNCEAFLLYFLAKNPRVQKRLYNEIITVLPQKESTLTKDNFKNMPYLNACLKESLRLRPAFPYLTRLLPSTISIHGYTIPKGTYVIMANQIASQREELFEDPEKFRPERWLNQNEFEQTSCQEYGHLPFGHGIRSCLGRDMAETQMMLLTTKLVREFTIEYDYADIRSQFYMMNVPNRPLRFRFIDRN